MVWLYVADNLIKMGLTFTKLFSRLFAKKEMRILMVGLDAAGKTTILYKLKLGEIVTTIPTIGKPQSNILIKNSIFWFKYLDQLRCGGINFPHMKNCMLVLVSLVLFLPTICFSEDDDLFYFSEFFWIKIVITCHFNYGSGSSAGFNVETVEYKNISFTVWDVGGQDKVTLSLSHASMCASLDAHCDFILDFATSF